MKKLLIVFLIISGVTVKAQHDVSVDVLGFAFSKYGVGYEYAINKNNSVGINFNMTTKNMFHGGQSGNTAYSTVDGKYGYSEMNIIPEYKAFFTPQKGNDGVYMGIYAKYRSSKSKDNTYTDTNLTATTSNPLQYTQTDVSTSGLSLGVIAGYKWKTSGALFLEATVGVGKFLMNNITYDSPAEDDANFNEDDYTPYIGNKLPVDLRLSLKIGIRIGGGKSSE